MINMHAEMASFWFPGPWTKGTSVVSLTTATAAAMFPSFKMTKHQIFKWL